MGIRSKSHSLVTQLTTCFAFVIMLSGALFIMATYHTGKTDAELRTQDKLDSVLAYLEGAVELPVWNLDINTVRYIGNTIAQDMSIQQIIIEDTTGEVLFELNKEQKPSISGQADIYHSNKKIGAVQVSVFKAPFEEQFYEYINSTITALVIEISALVIFAGVLIRRLLRKPFSELEQLINHYSEGNYKSHENGSTYKEFQSTSMVLKTMGTKIVSQIDELRDFVYIAAHDFKEPLRKIHLFSDRLAEQTPESLNKRPKYLERLQHSTIRMMELMDDLGKYSGVINSNQKTNQSINLKNIIQEVSTDLEILLKETQGKVEIDTVATIQGDPFQIRGLFHNLIANALKYHKKNIPPMIKITGQISTVKDGFYEIRVEDNGIGFNEKYAPLIFKPFERLHLEGEYEGTGMGLTLTKKIVERHGGSIEVKSKLNEGTVFIINLPLTQLATTKHSNATQDI